MAALPGRFCCALSVTVRSWKHAGVLSGTVRKAFVDALDQADLHRGARGERQKKGGQRQTWGGASAHQRVHSPEIGGAGPAEWPAKALLCPQTKRALMQQRERCKSVPAAARNVFDEWCASNGVLDELACAFRVHPFPESYFQKLAEFEDRVLRPHDAELQNELGRL